jgi:hypothetical protein
MNVFAAWGKASLDTQDTRGLNLAVGKLTTVQGLSCRCSARLIKIHMICLAKQRAYRGLVYSAKERSFYKRDTYTWRKPSQFANVKPIFSSERILHKDYDRNGSAYEKRNIWS